MFSTNTILTVIVTSSNLFFSISDAFAQIAEPSSKKIYKSLIVETVYQYTLTKLVPSEKLSLDTTDVAITFPEHQDVIRAHFAAIRNLNYSQFLNTWDKPSRDLMFQKDQMAGYDSKYWIERWRSVAMGPDIVLLNRIEYQQYVIYHYQAHLRGKPFEDSIALVREGKNWNLTQALSTSPILNNWNAPNGRIQVAPTLLRKQ